jgi:2-C-methyl-D-erythritol 4-phosphate cytidylyltransferase
VAVALIVAAGSGERLGASRPKAFVTLAGKPMLQWSVEAMSAAPAVGEIVVALPPGEAAPEGTVGIPGGDVRSASVRAALSAARADERVVVHDAARPLVTPELVERTLAALDGVDGAIAAAPVPDTIKEATPDGLVAATLRRERLWAVQTPQAFRRTALERALDIDEATLAAATDDSWLVERTGGRVRIVESSEENLKVTTPADLRRAEMLLGERC